MTAKIHVDSQTQLKFCVARSVPFVLWDKVEGVLDRLEKEGVILPVQSSEWAPIVPVVKMDHFLYVVDYKLTVNRAAKLDTYPLLAVVDLLASLAGGKAFSKLGLALHTNRSNWRRTLRYR